MPPYSLAERRAKLLVILAERGQLTLTQMQAAINVSRHAVERALSCNWFVRVTSGRGALYDLSDLGRNEVHRAG